MKIMKYGFTLMELMVVVTIVGIVIAFAIPNYTRSVERAHLKVHQDNLITMAAAQKTYKAANGVYWNSTPGYLDTLTTISNMNTALGLHVMGDGSRADSVRYLCQALGNSFSCYATWGGAPVTVGVLPHGFVSFTQHYVITMTESDSSPQCVSCP